MSQSSFPKSGKTVLVTGATGGMAAGINQELIEAGYAVVCVDLNEKLVSIEVDRLLGLGGSAFGFTADVSDSKAVQKLVDHLDSRSIHIDGLVNAAGILDRKSLLELDGESFDRVIQVNLVGPFNLIRALAPAMIANQWGRVINISSIAARNGYPYPSYAASKAGLSNLTRSLINDFWGTGVTVHNICPGLVNTPMADPNLIKAASKRIPTGKPVEPNEIGSAVVFLMNDFAASLNGSDIVMDGGVTSYFQLFERTNSQE